MPNNTISTGAQTRRRRGEQGPQRVTQAPPPPLARYEKLVREFLSELKPATQDIYHSHLRHFAESTQKPLCEAVRDLTTQGRQEAENTLSGFVRYQDRLNYATSTTVMAQQVIIRLVRVAYQKGLCRYSLDTQPVLCDEPKDQYERLLRDFLKSRSNNTKKQYLTTIRDFARWTGGEAIRKLCQTPGLAGKYLDGLTAADRTKGSVGQYRSKLKQLLGFAELRGLCDNITEAELKTEPVNTTAITRVMPEVLDMPVAGGGYRELVETFLGRRSKATRDLYAGDLRTFARWLDVRTTADAASRLLSGGQGQANQLVFRFKAYLRDQGKSPATINRALAAIKAMCKVARTIGVSDVTIEVENEQAVKYRDTQGPGVERVRDILADLEDRIQKGCRRSLRDRAMALLLYLNGLRVAEVCGVDVEHYDRRNKKLWILGKQRSQREAVTLSERASDAMNAWLAVRSTQPGALFISYCGKSDTPRLPYQRITTRHVRRWLVDTYDVKPHGFRHSAITRALDATGGDVRAVQRFSRHRSLDVIQKYDDNRQDFAGQISNVLDGDL